MLKSHEITSSFLNLCPNPIRDRFHATAHHPAWNRQWPASLTPSPIQNTSSCGSQLWQRENDGKQSSINRSTSRVSLKRNWPLEKKWINQGGTKWHGNLENYFGVNTQSIVRVYTNYPLEIWHFQHSHGKSPLMGQSWSIIELNIAMSNYHKVGPGKVNSLVNICEHIHWLLASMPITNIRQWKVDFIKSQKGWKIENTWTYSNPPVQLF